MQCLKYNPGFQWEGQFLCQQNTVYRKQQTIGLQNLVQKIWRFRQDFELSDLCLPYPCPGPRTSTAAKACELFSHPVQT